MLRLDKIVIENYKSIEKIEFDIKKYGDSYTTMLIGINESGKSSILEAMSFLNATLSVPEKFDYNLLHNQKDEEDNPIYFRFYFSLENKFKVLKQIKSKIRRNRNYLNFDISNIVKTVYLPKGKESFLSKIDFQLTNLSEDIYIKAITNELGIILKYDLAYKNDGTYEWLTERIFKTYFSLEIEKIIVENEPKISFWRPSFENLITEVDLNNFKDNPNLNIPLRNIFALAGYTDYYKIKEKIEESSHSYRKRHQLNDLLSDRATKYVRDIWKHKIKIFIEITESKKCNVSIQDEGEENKYNYFSMHDRSAGFKQFMSLILSLSVETRKLGRKNNLILIDEPETHLHPSAIRDLRDELIKIGKDNYLFVATHSPFLIDIENKERHIIIKKNKKALTEKKLIKTEEDLRDDEVLQEAFGINVYKDLLIRHRILVEGASDRKILQKVFKLKNFEFGVTNGIGSNIVQVASIFNRDDIKVLVVVDDDEDGRNYKEKILKIEGVFSEDNVFTIRDLCGGIVNKGTIEDVLGKDYIESKFKNFYKNEFNEDIPAEFSLSNTSPFLDQIKKFLHQKKKFKKETLEKFKKQVSDDFKPSKERFKEKYELLECLVEAIKTKLQGVYG